MSTTSIGDCRAVPYEQYERARRLLVDALFVGAFDKTTLVHRFRETHHMWRIHIFRHGF